MHTNTSVVYNFIAGSNDSPYLLRAFGQVTLSVAFEVRSAVDQWGSTPHLATQLNTVAGRRDPVIKWFDSIRAT